MSRLFALIHAQRRGLLLACGVLTLLGVIVGARLPAAILPEVTFPRITVIADSGERPGDEMLRAVTRPLESAIRRVPRVRELRSITSRGSSELNLDCEWGTDMELALQRVQAGINSVRERLPSGTSVDARLMSPALFPVLGLSLASKTRSLAELRDLAVMVLQPELGRLPGVAEVVVQGGRRLEARVTLDPAALEARGLDVDQVAEVLRRAGTLSTVGWVDANRQLYLGLVDARPIDLATLAATPVAVPDGPPVPLSALGRVSLEEAPEFTRYVAQSREAVLVNVLRRPQASTIGLAHAVREWLATHRRSLPADVRVETFYDQSDLVRASVGSVRDSLVTGALMAIAVIVIFLGSLRMGWAAAAVLPGSIALTLLGFVLTRQSLNMMTLGGIAAAVGLVLDDTVVVLEHMAYRAASTPAQRAIAMAEIFPSLVGSSLCTIAIFLPFMALSGVAGAFFRVLAMSMTLMLTSSFLLCVTLVPLLGGARHSPPSQRREGRGLVERVLSYATAHAWIAFVVLGLLITSIAPLKLSLGSAFLPEMDEGSLILDYLSPPGTSVTETDRILRDVERQVAATPEIVSWSRRTGDQLGFFITEPNQGDYVLRLRPGHRRSADQVADDLRRRIEASQPALRIEFGQLVEDVIGDLTSTPQPIELRIFGEDRRLIEQRAFEAARIVSGVRGVVDVKSGVVVSGPNLAVVPSPEAARLGLSAYDLTTNLAPWVNGIEAGEIVRGARSWPVRVTFAARSDPDPRSLIAARVATSHGHSMPLAELASVRVEPGETEIARDNQRTMVSVTARLSGRDLGSAMAEIQRRIRKNLVLGPGMSIQYGGLWAEQQASFRGLAAVLVASTASVLLILLVAFRSWRQTGAVLLVVVASLAGVFVALHASGSTFNISSFVGAIMVVGVVAENGYFLVAAHRQALGRGESAAQAARSAALRRARPVGMTTAAGVAALAPLAVGWGAGSALLKPLAAAVVGGFLGSAPLLLLVLPALLARTGPLSE